MPRQPTLEESQDAYAEREERPEEVERARRQNRAISMRFQGWGHRLVMQWYGRVRSALAILEAHRDQHDPYQHGIKPEDLHDRKAKSKYRSSKPTKKPHVEPWGNGGRKKP